GIAPVAAWSPHPIERMQDHYSTVSGSGQRVSIAKVIALMTPAESKHAAALKARGSIPGAPLGAMERRIRAPTPEPQWCSTYGRWCSKRKNPARGRLSVTHHLE